MTSNDTIESQYIKINDIVYSFKSIHFDLFKEKISSHPQLIAVHEVQSRPLLINSSLKSRNQTTQFSTYLIKNRRIGWVLDQVHSHSTHLV